MSEPTTAEALAEFGPQDVTSEKLAELKSRLVTHAPKRRRLVRFVAELAEKAPKVRNPEKVHDTCLVLGALQWALSRFDAAAKTLARVKRHDFARELEAECCLEAGIHKQAFKLYTKLAEKTPCVQFDMGKVASLRGLGETGRANELLESFGDTYDDEAEFHFQVGLKHDLAGDYDSAIEEYQRAIELDEKHLKSLFRLSYIADLRGDDETAVGLYERCAAIRPAHVNPLINLGVLYEDMGRYEDAVSCFERVLKWNPNHERAKLFFRDAKASITMYYDEERERKVDRQNKVLEIPVTDFELSVRSRNCLERMNAKTLGDLTHVTEAELLSYKNFGETSLNEIKAMMASKGLRLGQALEKDAPSPRTPSTAFRVRSSDEGEASKPISDLELSVRSRKCMQRLGVATIGEVCQKTGDELLACKNFGQTSLNEIKQKLANLGLKLRENK